jgi:hypothetical protein
MNTKLLWLGLIFMTLSFFIGIIGLAVHGQTQNNETTPCAGSPGYYAASKYGCCQYGSKLINGLCYDKKALAYKNANGSSFLSNMLFGHNDNLTLQANMLLRQILHEEQLQTNLTQGNANVIASKLDKISTQLGQIAIELHNRTGVT